MKKKYLLFAIIFAPLLYVLYISYDFIPYPIKVSFHFNYDQQPIETSYITTVRKELGNYIGGSLFRYARGRDRVSLKLSDGALVILRPEWPIWGQNYETGRRYETVARWFWQDDVRKPEQVVYGDGAKKNLETGGAPAPFVWLDVSATVERLDRTYLFEAWRADAIHDDDDKIEFSNLLGGIPNFHGTLFTSLVITPLATDEQVRMEKLDHSSGWISASGTCRYKPLQQSDLGLLVGLSSYADRIRLLRDGPGWRADVGSRLLEPMVMYSTKLHVDALDDGFSVARYRGPALKMVHEIKWDGRNCGGIEVPGDAASVVLQFDNGKFGRVDPSDSIAVLGD